ncbi:MAG: hypothetical protein ISR58_07475 [Anaerolineales bacterium]|nr:hypothetical protein [Chloroflexota bacterium]MBL6981017.1 hypothetical protein [Anaerolineales bacterium]
MKYLSAIVLAAIFLALSGSGVMAAEVPVGGVVTIASSPIGTEGTTLYGSAYSYNPTITIISVAEDATVTVQGYNFPPNDTFYVRMNYMGTQGKSGVIVETITSDSSGNLTDTTYPIPSELDGEYQIALRIISPASGYFAYNWFYNNSSGTGGIPTTTTGYSGIPTFAITAVKRDINVTIGPTNFPPNDTFWVRMNWMHTQGIAGVVVQTVTTDANGNLSDLDYPIPAFLHGSYQIAIRLESINYPYYYAYNWFYNNSTY